MTIFRTFVNIKTVLKVLFLTNFSYPESYSWLHKIYDAFFLLIVALNSGQLDPSITAIILINLTPIYQITVIESKKLVSLNFHCNMLQILSLNESISLQVMLNYFLLQCLGILVYRFIKIAFHCTHFLMFYLNSIERYYFYVIEILNSST